MKHRYDRCFLVVLLPLLVVGCELLPLDFSRSRSGPVPVTPGEAFVLEAGETAAVEEADLRLTFEEVIEDSRCPEGVTCVWAGRAKLRFDLSYDDRSEQVTLTIPASPAAGDVDAVERAGYRIRLLQLEPAPTADGPEEVAYRARLVVETVA